MPCLRATTDNEAARKSGRQRGKDRTTQSGDVKAFYSTRGSARWSLSRNHPADRDRASYRERNAAVQQQTATAEVLKVIGRTTFDLQTVLDTLVESACRHCNAYDSIIFLRHGERLHVRAHFGPLQLDFHDWPIGRGWITGRAVVDRTVIHVYDPAAFAPEYPDGSEMARRLGYRTILSVPMLRGDEAVGALTIRRSEVKPFSDAEIELVETFAAQAVIAIENARLLNELRQRTDDLTESLEQQTATSEVLRVISSSPGQLEPVFQATLENAVRICEAKFGSLFRFDGEEIQFAAEVGTPPEYAEFQKRRKSVQPRPGPYWTARCGQSK